MVLTNSFLILWIILTFKFCVLISFYSLWIILFKFLRASGFVNLFCKCIFDFKIWFYNFILRFEFVNLFINFCILNFSSLCSGMFSRNSTFTCLNFIAKIKFQKPFLKFSENAQTSIRGYRGACKVSQFQIFEIFIKCAKTFIEWATEAYFLLYKLDLKA